jgi:hypothetical protein
VASLLLLAATAAALGWLRQDAAGRVDLGPWLVLEVLGGAAAGVLGGALSRRIARRTSGPGVLALLLFGVGVLEAAEILGSTASGRVAAPQGLVLLAPAVAAAGVLLGGRLSAKGWSERAARQAAAPDRAVRGG